MPAQWLFTDERLGGGSPADPLWRAIGNLPRGGGIVFRHYGWAEAARCALFAQIAAIARRRRLVLVASRLAVVADGCHRPAHARRAGAGGRGLTTASAHDATELRRAFAGGADLVFLSPVFATPSHPGKGALGPLRFGLLVRGAPGPVLALGGMDAARARRLKALGASGYGGIDCWAGPRASRLALGRGAS